METGRNPQPCVFRQPSLSKLGKPPRAPMLCAPTPLPPPTRGAGRAQAEGRQGRADSGCARRAALGLVAGRDRQRSGFGQRRYLPARESCPAGKNPAPAFTFGYTSGRDGQGDREPLTLGTGGRREGAQGTRGTQGPAPPRAQHRSAVQTRCFLHSALRSRLDRG